MHILLGTDGSDLALDATKRGLALLGNATKVTMLSVINDVASDTGGGIEGPIYTAQQQADIQKSETEHAQHAIASTETAVKRAAPNATIEHRVETGDPAATICRIATELDVDVIVVGSHGKGFLSRVLLGSVSEYVTRHAPCPVLVVRSEPTSD